MRSVTKHYYDFEHKDGTTVALELTFGMSDTMAYKDVLTKTGDDRITIGYLVDDSDVENPLENDEYMGQIYDCRRHSRTLGDYEKALGLRDGGPDLDLIDHMLPDDADYASRLAMWKAGREAGTVGNPYAVLLDIYEHGGVSYSVSGGGMQCQFDTAHGGAVWVPSEALKVELDERAATDLPSAQEKALELAAQACTTYTDWCNGNCYGIVVATYDNEGNSVDEDDVCWGFIGDDNAYEALKDDYFPKEENDQAKN